MASKNPDILRKKILIAEIMVINNHKLNREKHQPTY